ncbi:TetR/AcrR family transcriptional regulator [Streptomyces sp. H27-D2]|uniref:TetR/AcrR family transcriptional regulator n=1 Tax=Streptomyces sp. H27-D2 TaxID=3046304 RepID=UPI002DB56B73|nr:TetR/AcrR family transcriptional regulator [Streptomyces sp. H27-D2]MEC4018902.1 TetR/AcrR family transcriptional regulator [Streptomyces sp. H27-D2]
MTSGSRTSRPPRTSVWLADRPAPKRKSEQPAGLDREKIIAATVRRLDAEGLAKFSMRRLAAELGVTAMSVYWYVDTKDDLLELALDSVHGELTLPDETPPDEGERADAAAGGAQRTEGAGGAGAGDWRDQLRLLAAEYRKLLVTHPWVSRLVGQYLNCGPRSLGFSNAAQRVMQRSGLSEEDQIGALSMLFQFVYGFGTIEGSWADRCRLAGLSEDEYSQQVMEAVQDRPEFEESRQTLKLRGGNIRDLRQRDFAFALDTVIAGLEAMRGRSR